jgi:hypothetical protein
MPLIAGGVLGSATGGVDSLMEISSAAPSSSTWKLNNSKAILKPLVLAETDTVKLEMGSTVVVARESMANTGVDSMTVGDAVSMSMADEAMSMSMVVGDGESTAVAGGEPSILVDVARSAMVGEGASESIDPDPVVPTVGAN